MSILVFRVIILASLWLVNLALEEIGVVSGQAPDLLSIYI